MTARQGTYSVLYGIQRRFLNIFYLVSAVAVFWLVFYILHEIVSAGAGLIILLAIAYLVLIVTGYSIIHVIAYIPANLAAAFDPLKNAVAGGSIVRPEDFAGALADFMCSFFNFSFFDIGFALVHLTGHRAVASTNLDLNATDIDLPALERYAAKLDRTSACGKIRTEDGSMVLHLTPIVFGDRRLGYMAVACKRKLWRIFMRFLDDFENDFVDDQVVHVLRGAAAGSQ